MQTSGWFEEVPVIGKLPPEPAAGKLREVGEDEAATRLEQSEGMRGETFKIGGRKSWWPFQDKAWQHTAHTFGYLAPAVTGSAGRSALPIRHIENMTADTSLRGMRIKLTLNRLRIAAYPGGGMHHRR